MVYVTIAAGHLWLDSTEFNNYVVKHEFDYPGSWYIVANIIRNDGKCTVEYIDERADSAKTPKKDIVDFVEKCMKTIDLFDNR
jgi:hypothetical protein